MTRLQDVMYDTIPEKVVVSPTIVDVLVSCEEVTTTDEMSGEPSTKYKCTIERYETTEYVDKLQKQMDSVEAQTTQAMVGLTEVYEMMLG